jgi:hypothetical protein
VSRCIRSCSLVASGSGPVGPPRCRRSDQPGASTHNEIGGKTQEYESPDRVLVALAALGRESSRV